MLPSSGKAEEELNRCLPARFAIISQLVCSVKDEGFFETRRGTLVIRVRLRVRAPCSPSLYVSSLPLCLHSNTKTLRRLGCAHDCSGKGKRKNKRKKRYKALACRSETFPVRHEAKEKKRLEQCAAVEMVWAEDRNPVDVITRQLPSQRCSADHRTP